MAEAPSLIYNDAPGTIPASYRFPPGLTARLSSVSARFDGTGASGTFLACLAVYSQDGKLIGRWFPSQVFASGDSGEVSYGPFLGGEGSLSSGIPVSGLADFEPVGGLLEITSTTPSAGTPIIQSGSFVADGNTIFRIDLAIAAMDIAKLSGAGGMALLIHLLRDTTELGIIADWNLPQSNSDYISAPVFISALDTPPAGTHTYSLTGVKATTGTASGKIFVYGDGIFPPTSGTTHPGYVAVYPLAVSA